MAVPQGNFAAAVAGNGTYASFQTCTPPAARTNPIETCTYSIIPNNTVNSVCKVAIQRLGWDGTFRTILTINASGGGSPNQPIGGRLDDFCPCFGFQFVVTIATGQITYMDFVATVRS